MFDRVVEKPQFDPDHLNELISDGDTSATLSTVFLWGGAGLAVVSIVLFVVDGLNDGAVEEGVSFVPVVEPGRVGAAIDLRF